jgi:hypothetical protein
VILHLLVWIFGYCFHQWTDRFENTMSIFSLSLSLFLVVLGFELGFSWLLGRSSIIWAMPPAFFALVILELESHFLSQLAWIIILLFYTSWPHWDDRCAPPHPAISWDGVLKTVCQGWPGTAIFQNLVSQIASITGVSHCHLAHFHFSYI